MKGVIASAVVLSLLCLAGCGESTSGPGNDVAIDATEDVGSDVSLDTQAPPSPCIDVAGVTYQRDIRPLLMTHCFDCHSEVNGSVSAGSSYDWTTWDNVNIYRQLIVADVRSRVMPPWPMDPDCRSIQNSRALDDATIAVFEAWEDNGFCEGDAADFVDPGWKPVSTDYSDAELTTQPAAAWTIPDEVASGDVFRCYKLATSFDEDTWVTATATSPDSPLSHHALIYVAKAESEASVDALDAQFDGAGWGNCENGIGVPSIVLSGWVPGMSKIPYPKDAAYLVPKGSILLLQMHYSGVGATEKELEQKTDHPQIHLWTLPQGQLPKYEVTVRPYADHSFSVPLGETETTNKSFTVSADADIFAVVSHQHAIGTKTSLTLQKKDGSEACLSNIPKWDFNWQLIYNYTEDDLVAVNPGDTIKLSCTYPYTEDWVKAQLGSAAPDPLPDTLIWGEASYEEMCISYVWSMSPLVIDLSFEQCIAACDQVNSDCVIDCVTAPNMNVSCILDGLSDCGESHCETETQDFFGCLQSCDMPNKLACVRNNQKVPPCLASLDAFVGCLSPHLTQGSCSFAGCD